MLYKDLTIAFALYDVFNMFITFASPPEFLGKVYTMVNILRSPFTCIKNFVCAFVMNLNDTIYYKCILKLKEKNVPIFLSRL